MVEVSIACISPSSILSTRNRKELGMVVHAWKASGSLRVPGQMELCSKILLRSKRETETDKTEHKLKLKDNATYFLLQSNQSQNFQIH